MARIRTIKPEFFHDGVICRLSDTTALFFISIWNHADDAGYFTIDPLELSKKTGRWRSQDMMKMLSALDRAGLVRLSRGDGVGMVVGWSHQRIDKPRSSKWEGVEIQWDDPAQFPEPSKNVPRKERKGEEGRGSERRGSNIAPSVSSKRLEAAVVLPEFASLESVIRERGVTEKVQRAWLAAFPEPEWIITEVRKGLAWEAANPSRSKKNFGAFMTRWMTKGWDQRRVPPMNSQASGKSVLQILEEAGR